jgi:hypothetical protein
MPGRIPASGVQTGRQRLRLLEERLLLELRLPDERLLLLRALARSLWALLFLLLARAPLLEAWARLLLRPDDDLPEEGEELRDAIACSLDSCSICSCVDARPQG